LWRLIRKSPAQQREAALLRQWRQDRRAVNRETFLLAFLLSRACRRLEATQQAARANSSFPPALPRATKNGARLTLIAKPPRAPWLSKWSSRLRSLPLTQSLHRRLVLGRRKVLIKSMALTLRLAVQLSRGRRKCSPN
jgi:hypothetical protein